MRVTVKLYALLGQYLPPGSEDNQVSLTVDPGSTPEDIFAKLNLPPQHCHLVLVNGVYVPPGQRAFYSLKENDALAAWPPIGGGLG